MQAALEEKGFKVVRWTRSNIPTAAALKEHLGRKTVTQLWLISDSVRHLNQDHINVIK